METLLYMPLMLVFVFVWAFVAANKEEKAQKKRNAAYKSQYGRSMKLMTVHGIGKVKEITRSSNGEVYGKVSFKAEESHVVSHRYKAPETVYRGVNIGGVQVGSSTYDPGGMVAKNHKTGKGRVVMSDYPSEYTVEKVVLSPDAQKLFGADPLYRKYAVNGTIRCDNGSEFTDRELATYAGLKSYLQDEYASIIVNQKCLSYKECEEIVTLLRRIQDGIFPDEVRKTEAKGKKTLAIILIGILLLGIFDLFLFMYLS